LEVEKTGIRIEFRGGVHHLPRHTPLKIAMGMVLTAKPITAAEGYRLALVNEVVPGKGPITMAERWARAIAECSPRSVQATKRAALEGLRKPLEDALVGRYEQVDRLFASQDVIEGPRAFAEKRAPR
jgi:crotonobetainyl-CoA hydratase